MSSSISQNLNESLIKPIMFTKDNYIITMTSIIITIGPKYKDLSTSNFIKKVKNYVLKIETDNNVIIETYLYLFIELNKISKNENVFTIKLKHDLNLFETFDMRYIDIIRFSMGFINEENFIYNIDLFYDKTFIGDPDPDPNTPKKLFTTDIQQIWTSRHQIKDYLNDHEFKFKFELNGKIRGIFINYNIYDISSIKFVVNTYDKIHKKNMLSNIFQKEKYPQTVTLFEYGSIGLRTNTQIINENLFYCPLINNISYLLYDDFSTAPNFGRIDDAYIIIKFKKINSDNIDFHALTKNEFLFSDEHMGYTMKSCLAYEYAPTTIG